MNKYSMITTICVALSSLACSVTSHPSVSAVSGTPAETARQVDYEEMLRWAKRPGEVELTRVVAADWAVDRAGLINLDHPRAEAAGLESGDEAIAVQFFGLKHPKHGLYMIDSGVAASFRSPDTAPVGTMVRSAMKFDALEVKVDTRQWLKEQDTPLRGIFMTHLHVDHIMGLPDVARTVPLYTGPGEAAGKRFVYLFSQGTADDMLHGFSALQELSFRRGTPIDGDAPLSVLDVFGDSSVFALHVPGHTQGSLAFLVRTPEGPALVAGDACHTSWGWKNSVEPGQFNQDGPTSAVSLSRLKRLEQQLPGLKVFPGHQHLEESSSASEHR